jgi:hypothetical protein
VFYKLVGQKKVRDMAITASGQVCITKLADVSVAKMIELFRDWLDANRVETTMFKSEVLADGRFVFKIGFRSNDHAAQFNRQFG